MSASTRGSGVCDMHQRPPYPCRESWKALAAGRGPPDARGAAEGQHVHLQFCNMIINDSTYLLGEALEKLPQVPCQDTLHLSSNIAQKLWLFELGHLFPILSVCLSVHPFHLPPCLPPCLPPSLPSLLPPSVLLSIHPSIQLSIRPLLHDGLKVPTTSQPF